MHLLVRTRGIRLRMPADQHGLKSCRCDRSQRPTFSRRSKRPFSHATFARAQLRRRGMPYRSDYDPFAEFEREQESEDGYEPYAEFRGEPRRQRSADALNFHERARRYGRPVVLSNGAGVAYWMDRDAEA